LCGKSFAGKNLSGANFRKADIRGTTFKGADLEGADFSEVIAGRYFSRTEFFFRTVAFFGSLTIAGFMFWFVYEIYDLFPKLLLISSAALVITIYLIKIFNFDIFPILVIYLFVFAISSESPDLSKKIILIILFVSAFFISWAIFKQVHINSYYIFYKLKIKSFIEHSSLYDTYKTDSAVAKKCMIGFDFWGLSNTNFQTANLKNANFTNANLEKTYFNKAILTNVIWKNSQGLLDRTDNKCVKYFTYTILEQLEVTKLLVTGNGKGKNYTNADISNTNLQGFDFRGANLTNTKAHNTDFSGADLTGIYIKDIKNWDISIKTKFDDVICEYIYLEPNQQKRHPSHPNNFGEGDFNKIFSKIIGETIDIYFSDGINWKIFDYSVKKLNEKYQEKFLLQSYEQEIGGIFILKLNVLEKTEAEKEEIYYSFNQIYETELQIIITDEDTIDEESSGGFYPYDPTEEDVDIRQEPYTVFDLMRKYKQGKLDINPEFQRNLVWTVEQKSKFIESIILNFPIPPFYVNRTKKGVFIIVDGLQRTSTLFEFMDDKFELTGLETLSKFNGYKFSKLIELPGNYQTRIEDKKFTLYIIKPSVPIRVVYDIYERINFGGTPLNRQEIRNCILIGKATKLLNELSAEEYFKKAIDNGVSPNRMKDREAILRYLAFKILDYKTDYNDDMSFFIEEAMKTINLIEDTEIEKLKKDFKRVMTLTFKFFGDRNFRLPTGKTRGRINFAILESVGYFFSIQSDSFLEKNKQAIQNNFNKLLQDKSYVKAVKSSVGTQEKVKARFERVKEILGNV